MSTTITVKAYYKKCKGAAQVASVSKPADKKWFLDATLATETWSGVTTTTARCAKFLIYTPTLPDNIKAAKLGKDALFFGNARDTHFGNTITWN